MVCLCISAMRPLYHKCQLMVKAGTDSTKYAELQAQKWDINNTIVH